MFSGEVKGVFKKTPYGIGVLLENDGTINKGFYSDKPSHFPGTECRKDEYIKTYKHMGGVKVYSSEKIIMPNGCFVGTANMMTGEHNGEYCDDNGTKYSGNFSGKLFTKIMNSKRGENVMTSENDQNIFTVTYANGDKYVGLLNNGLKNGKGEFSLSNGEKYTGVFENDNKQGIMKITTHGKDESKEIETSVIFKDNEIIAQNSEDFAVELGIELGVYTGDIKNGKPSGHGECVYTFDCGVKSKYVGEWKDGVRCGRGVAENNRGYKYDGEWANNKINGKGTGIFPNGNKYTGEWLNGKKHGKGVQVSVSGDRYDGEFANNVRQGKGTYIWVDGDRYDGEWLNDKRHGKGIIVYADGARYDGEWLNDEPHGKGVLTLPNGKKIKGYELKMK